MSKVISFRLSEKEINQAIKEVKTYKTEFIRKINSFEEKIAKKITDDAQARFNNAVVDDLLSGAQLKPQVSVSWSNNGNVMVVVAEGKDAVWVEFGTGVYYNGSVGSSPHPRGTELGMTIGTYGKGRGKQEKWVFETDGEKVWTHGAPASMPMYNAAKAIANDIDQIAKEVFR